MIDRLTLCVATYIVVWTACLFFIMSDNEEENKAGEATGTTKASASELTVAQIAELISKMSPEDQTQLSGKLNGARPKVAPNASVSRSVNNGGGQNQGGSLDASNDRGINVNKLPKLPKFSGADGKNEPSFRVWRFEIDNLSELYSEREVNRVIHQSVTGDAAETLMRLGRTATVTQILNKFDHVFGSVVSDEKLLANFYTAQQKPAESIAEWSCRLEDILCHPNLAGQISDRDKMLKSRFFYGLHSDNIKNAIRHRFELDTYDQLLVLAREAEDENKSEKAVKISKPQTVELNPQLKEIQEQLKQIQLKMSQYDKKLGSYSKNKSSTLKQKGDTQASMSSERNVRCFYCKKLGHVKKNCGKLLKGKSPSVGNSQ